jgi:peptidoglycan/LPS O-acetylase OafA/YrhL
MIENLSLIQAVKRQKARYVTYIDLLFVIAPFIFLAIHKFSIEIIYKSDWALAAALLFGQASARLLCGLMKHKVENWHIGGLYSVGLIIAALCSVYLYSFLQDSQNVAYGYYIFQALIFLFSIFCFIIFGAVGQRLMDLPEDKPK